MALQASEGRLLELYQKLKKEAFNERYTHERQWQRNINYFLGRQWIYYHPRRRAWVDKALAKWVPKPVTNVIATGTETIHSVFQAVDLGVVVRPVGGDPDDIMAAAAADEHAPLLHEDHGMDEVLDESDWWYVVTGNVFWQTWWDWDHPLGMRVLPMERCLACHQVLSPDHIGQAGARCPACGTTAGMMPGGRVFTPAIGQDGAPLMDRQNLGAGRTDALSPFEVALPPNFWRFRDVPYVFRKRWRDRSYYEELDPNFAKRLQFGKAPHDQGMQIFRSFAQQNTMEPSTVVTELSIGMHGEADGIDEFELWLKPTNEFPDGLVLRVADPGGEGGIIVPSEEEGLPGEFPFTDVKGAPLFPFVHAGYQRVGGRVFGVGPIDKVVQKQDHLNQTDSLILLSINRCANPIYMEPHGANVQRFTGEPGLVIRWDPLGAGGAKPERLEGISPATGLFTHRAQLIDDVEELLGTRDILKGQRPPNVESFAAISLLQERAQSRFTSPLKQRGRMYRDWFKLAIEMERQLGPPERLRAVMGPNQTWAAQVFKNAKLQGSVSVSVEDGTNVPKTALGKRASMAEGAKMGLVDLTKPDTKAQALKMLGLTSLDPSLDANQKSALREQNAFETWVKTGAQGPSPLRRKAWDDDVTHDIEHRKYFNSDRFQALIGRSPLAPLVEQEATRHLTEHGGAIIAATGEGGSIQQPGGDHLQGGDRGLMQSNQEAGSTDVAAESGGGPA